MVVAVFDGVEGGDRGPKEAPAAKMAAQESAKTKSDSKSHHKVLTAIRRETCRPMTGLDWLEGDSKKQSRFWGAGAGFGDWLTALHCRAGGWGCDVKLLRGLGQIVVTKV